MTTLELRNKLVFWSVASGLCYKLHKLDGMNLVVAIGIAAIAGIVASLLIALITDQFFD